MSPGLARRVRRLGLSVVPPASRARLRHLYEAVTLPSTRADASFEDVDKAVRVTVPGLASLLIVPESRTDLDLKDARQRAELAAFWSEARRPGVLFDVGANTGLFSLLYCLAHPRNRAVAFEPSSILAERIERNARLNGTEARQTVVCEAVADAPGHIEMLTAGRDGYVQVAPFAGTAHANWQRAIIKKTTLDLATSLETPTLVKIDVEGFELEALRGAAHVLEHIRPVVFLELHLNFLEERRISPMSVLDELTSRGYRLFRLSGRPLSSLRAARSWASILHLIARPDAVR